MCGGMIFTFYKALGYDIGSSLVEDDIVELAGELMKKAEAKGVKLILPPDVIVADSFSNNANSAVSLANEISGEWMGLDIGPETLKLFEKEIAKSNTIVFNGPMGVFEMPNFANGTVMVAEVAAVNQAGLGDKVSHISTGGGASLELLEGKELPGVAALTEV